MNYKSLQNMLNTLNTIRCEMESLEKMIQREKAQIQETCEHDFTKILESDYHKNSWCYTCIKCEYWTYIKPVNLLK